MKERRRLECSGSWHLASVPPDAHRAACPSYLAPVVYEQPASRSEPIMLPLPVTRGMANDAEVSCGIGPSLCRTTGPQVPCVDLFIFN